MNITVLNKYRVETELSSAELAELGITYEELDYGNIETRRALWILLDRVEQLSGIKIRLSGRLLIEAFKENEEVCRICFTSLPPHRDDDGSLKQLVKTETVPLIAEFSCFDCASLAARASCLRNQSFLYENNGKYRLVFNIAGAEKERLSARLCEYGDIIENSPVENARCLEMWHCIARENAVDKIKDLC